MYETITRVSKANPNEYIVNESNHCVKGRKSRYDKMYHQYMSFYPFDNATMMRYPTTHTISSFNGSQLETKNPRCYACHRVVD